MIPCKECPVLAICRTKERVKCEIIFNLEDLSHEDIIFNEVKEILPNLREIEYNDLIISYYRTALTLLRRKH